MVTLTTNDDWIVIVVVVFVDFGSRVYLEY